MEATTIRCPRCQHEFPLTEAVEQQVAGRLRAAFETQARQQEAQHQAQLRQAVEAAQRQAAETLAVEMKDLQARVAEQAGRLRAAEQQELELRKARRELEDRQRALELELARQLDAERVKIRDETRLALDEEFRLKEAEKDKQLGDLRRQIDELKRKAEQGSQQMQGEVLELGLEAALRNTFPDDQIIAVPKGQHGGDVLQHVRDTRGAACGAILWELKRTKAWAEGWLMKLKDDQIAAKADVAALITTTLPRDVTSFTCRAGVWLAPPALALALAGALRILLVETAAARRAHEGKQEKMEVLYTYLAGPEFKRRVQAIAETFRTLREGLEQERRAMQRIWAAREKQLDRVLANTAGLHGDLAGIIGGALPPIDALELRALPGAIADIADEHDV